MNIIEEDMRHLNRSRVWFVQALAAFVILAPAGGLTQALAPDQTLKQLLSDFLAAASHTPASAEDKRFFNAFFADDVVYTRATGVVFGKFDIMKSLEDQVPPRAPTVTYAAEDITVRSHGEIAIVTFRLIQKLSGGTTNRYRNTATFLNRAGVWQVVAWQATRIDAS